jgi:hypothetical protein
MVLYRLYTEDIKGTENLVSWGFEGFTLIKAQGYWKGKVENSLVIEILVDTQNDEADAKVFALADRIKACNKQESVLVTAQIIEAKFV